MKNLLHIATVTAFLISGIHAGFCQHATKPGVSKNKLSGDQPDKVAIKFLKWYCKNQEYLRHRHPFFNIDTTGDTTKFYSVNMFNVLLYLNELKRSGYVSVNFLNDIQKKYVNASNFLQLHPQNDGPIVDFQKTFTVDYGFDPVIELMEEDMLIEHINKIKSGQVIIQGNNSVVVLKISNYLTYTFIMHKQNKHWVIDSMLIMAG